METLNEDFVHAISNTIALFGGKDDILSIIQNKNLSAIDIADRLHRWNAEKSDEIKNRLIRLKGIKVVVDRSNDKS